MGWFEWSMCAVGILGLVIVRIVAILFVLICFENEGKDRLKEHTMTLEDEATAFINLSCSQGH